MRITTKKMQNKCKQIPTNTKHNATKLLILAAVVNQLEKWEGLDKGPGHEHRNDPLEITTVSTCCVAEDLPDMVFESKRFKKTIKNNTNIRKDDFKTRKIRTHQNL